MKRREAIVASIVLGVGVPFAVHGQQLQRVVLFLPRAGSREEFIDSFRAGMLELGWTDGREFRLEIRWTSGDRAEAEADARSVVASRPALIVAPGGAVAMPLHDTATTLPVVFIHSGDPVDAGLVASYSRPGGSFTGLTWLSLALVGKRLEMLREIKPGLRRVAVFADPRHAGEPKERAATREAAGALGLELRHYAVNDLAGLDGAMASARGERCEALDVYPDGFTLRNRVRIAEFAKAARMPSISGWLDYAEAGFLASYGVNRTESIRRLASYASRVLRGTTPANLPVEVPTIVESAVNLKTARALGLSIPRPVLARANWLIE